MMDPLLHRAARSGDISFLETLTADEEKRYFSQLTPRKNTLLLVAAEFKQAEFFEKVCLKCPPSLIWEPNSKDETSLHVAARVGCIEIVQFLVEQAPVSPYVVHVQGSTQHNVIRKKNKAGDTALHCAVRYGHKDVVEFLLRKDPVLSSFCNYSDESPLYLATANHLTSIAMLILDISSSSFSHTGPKGLTALHEAVCHESALKVVEELVKKRPEIIKEADDIGWTALHYATVPGIVEAVKIMLKYEVDSSPAYLLDQDGNSALHFAAYWGDVNIIEQLIQSCPDIFELTNNKGQTFLHVAALNGKVNVVEYILGNSQLGGLLNEADEDGNTPLHLAVLHDQKQIIKLLAKDERVDINVTNKEFKAACDIYFLSFREFGFKKEKITALFKERSYSRHIQHFVNNVVKEWLNRTPELKPYLLGRKEYMEQLKKSYQKFPEVYLVVATLVTTVSFSAAFTMPGGTDKGKPILAEKAAFKAFVICDILAFCFSLSVVCFQLATATFDHIRARYVRVQQCCFSIAMIAFAFAFASGIYITLAMSSHLLAIAAYVILCVFFFIYRACWLVDPFGGDIRIQKRWRVGKYYIEFRYGGLAGRIPSFTYNIVQE